jgi:2-methylcitrate dehydratase PrpD
MERIHLHMDPQADRQFPGQRSALVRMQLRDGREDQYLQPHRKGDPDLPLSDSDLNDKFMELVNPVLGEALARQRLNQLWQLETLTQIP